MISTYRPKNRATSVKPAKVVEGTRRRVQAYLPQGNPTSNRIEAMWYQSWQAGYGDILKRGFPKPKNSRAILAELRSPRISDFLHGCDGAVPFLVSARAREVLDSYRLTGFEYEPVIVAKIATKGARNRGKNSGEPEDSITKTRGISLVGVPRLFAVYVTGAVDIVPDFRSGKTPSGMVSPFRLKTASATPDLWRPSLGGNPFSAWAFCSEKFRRACEESNLTDIKFQSFDSFMADFRSEDDSEC